MIITKNLELNKINRTETLSFLGYKPSNKPDKNIILILDKYEELFLKKIQPRYIFKIFECGDTALSGLLTGSDINEHITSCGKIALICVTLGLEADKLISRTSISDVTGSIIVDALAGAAVEQVCDMCENDIKTFCKSRFSFLTMTSRFSPGYGDFPIEVQSLFLSKLDANKKIGLYVNENNILIPRKSVTAVIGIKV